MEDIVISNMANRKIRVLVITYLPWRLDNSIGNSYSNIFKGTEKDKYEFAQIYIRDGMPQNNIVHKYFHISETAQLKHLINPKVKVGRYFFLSDSIDMKKDTFGSLYNKARILRWEIFFMIRELVGLTNSWKTKELDNFIKSFNPDIVFGTLSTVPAINRLMWYVSEKKDIPLVTYPWDDYYSLRHSNISPMFWIRKWYTRHFLRKTALKSDYMYCISNLMIEEYSKEFGQDCRLLFKGYQFDLSRIITMQPHDPIRIVYMGNLGYGRWRTLGLLAQGIKKVNEKYKQTKIVMNVYSLSPINKDIDEALNLERTCKLNPPVPNDKVMQTMNEADILVHAESFKKTEMEFFRASFSTKLVDYFYNAKCILSIGGLTASTDYLIRNDASLNIASPLEIENTLLKIVENPSLLQEYARKSWNCGVRNHQISKIQERVYNDFVNVIEQHKK